MKNNLVQFSKQKWQKAHFPLWAMGWPRMHCLEWLRATVPYEVPRSACTFCPFHDDREWQWLKEQAPHDFERACEVDDGLRTGARAAQDNMKGQLYVHRSCQPLREVVFKPEENGGNELFSGVAASDCTGFCGH